MITRSTVAIIAAFTATFTLNLTLAKAISDDVAHFKFSEVVALNGRLFVGEALFDLHQFRVYNSAGSLEFLSSQLTTEVRYPFWSYL
jgi:hypothetical protein